ncbi:MAG TPA: ferredoxin family protein [Phycisphaerae bacterium]|nr:ferredoxin family protein [Phycisphaerae bacterium]
MLCRCEHADVIPAATVEEVLSRLTGAAAAVDVIPDLCELAARGDPVLRRIAESRPLRIAACYPRAVRWLFHAAGSPLPGEGVQLFNLRTQPPEEIAAGMLSGAAPGAQPLAIARSGGDWMPWFPVIDYDRCEDCKQCLNFCLFGVYAPDGDGRVRVAEPANCKTYCPACARICPQTAIIFPKYEKPPINGGEAAREDAGPDAVRVDLAERIRGDVYETLRSRGRPKQERFSADRPLSADEREEYLRSFGLDEKAAKEIEKLLSPQKGACPCAGDEKGCEREDDARE